MGKITLGNMLDRFCLTSDSCSCFCMNSVDEHDEFQERKLLVASENGQQIRLKDVVAGKQTLAFQLQPKTVTLRVSMHCNGCARKVGKHVSKIEGVTSYKVDLERRMVVVIGDIVPFEVLENVSKVKHAEFWESSFS